MFSGVVASFTRSLAGKSRRGPRPSSRRPRYVSLRLEGLEDRCVPTVGVTLNSGVLTITGDATANRIAVVELAAAGSNQASYQVFGDGLSLSVNPFVGVTSMVINTGGAPTNTVDEVFLIGDSKANGSGATSFLPGGLSITGAGGLTIDWGDGVPSSGSGVSRTTTGGFNVNGAVSISETGGGFLTLTVGDGATGTGTQVNNTLGATTITGGSGGTAVTVEAAGAISGPVAITLGTANNNTLLFDGAVVSGSLGVTSTGTNDLLTVQNFSNITGAATYSGTAPNSQVNAQVLTGSKIDGTFTVTSGAGNDVVNISTAHLNGGLSATLGAGSNALTFDRSVCNGNLVTQDAGTDTISLTNGGFNNNTNYVAGFVSLNNTSATSATTVTVTNATIGTFLSVVSGAVSGGVVSGSGNDSVTVTNTTIGTAAGNQNFQNNGVDLGGGNNTISYTNDNIVGTFFTDGNNGTDTVNSFSNNFVGFDVRFNDAASTTLNMTGAMGNNHVNDAVTISSGAGNDIINFTNSTIGAGGLTVNSGTGAVDSIFLDSLTVAGNVSISSTNQANNVQENVNFTNSVVEGNATFSGGTSISGQSVSFAGDDIMGTETITTGSGSDMIFGATTAVGLVTITTGNAGNGAGDQITFASGSVLDHGLTITTGSGADSIVTNNLGKLSLDTQIFGPVNINTGAGKDTVNLGTDATDLVQFFGNVTINGGNPSEGNVLNDSFAQYFGSRTVSNFP